MELWESAPDPAHPGLPTLTFNLSDKAEEAAEETAPPTAPLLRMYNPGLLRHAYTVTPRADDGAQAARLPAPGAGGTGVDGAPAQRAWAYGPSATAHYGYMMLATYEQPSAECKSLGRLGWMLGLPHPPSQPLYQLEGQFPDPLRGSSPRDMLYTSRADQLPRMQEQSYSGERLLCHLASEPKPTPQAPLPYTWQGTWAGDGWERFFLKQQDQGLYLFWYYSQSSESPQYHVRLKLSLDGHQATGIAVGQPGRQAIY